MGLLHGSEVYKGCHEGFCKGFKKGLDEWNGVSLWGLAIVQ